METNNNSPPTTRIHSGRVLLANTTTRPGRREYDCVFMQPGFVKRADQQPSNILIPATTIQAAARLFNAVSSYLDHPELFGFGWHQDPRVHDLVGVTFDARWSDEENALLGGIRLYDQQPGSPGAFVGALLDQILADLTTGREVPPVGLSAVLFPESQFDDEQGIHIWSLFNYVESVDFVYDAGAGGYVRAALSAAGCDQPIVRYWQVPHIGGDYPPPQGGNMNETNSTQDGGNISAPAPPPDPAPAPPEGDALSMSTLTLAVQQLSTRIQELEKYQLPPDPAPDPTFEVNALTQEVQRLSQALAAQEEGRTVEGMGQAPLARLYGGLTSLDQIEQAVEAMLAGVRPPKEVAPLTGIRELYRLLSGDYSMTGLFQEDNVYLANVNCTTMAGLVANALNKVVINTFQEYPQWWGPAVTIEDFATLQDVRWITLGGVGELPTVAEGAAYSEMTWDDQTETDEFVKKGGYLGITLEAIDKDDTRRITAAPRALAQAAWLTLGKAIAAIFTDNTNTGPAMSDSNYLFDASNHGNLLTTALSYAEWETVKTAMMKQTEINSGERLGALTRPRFLWVPIDLETLAVQILASEGEPGTADNDINVNAQGEGREARLANARKRVIVCPFWTETDHWAAQADPRLYPSIGLGFRYGRTPEIFSVASPTAGLMFSNDVMPIKVRFFFATGPTDWRGLHKSNV